MHCDAAMSASVPRLLFRLWPAMPMLFGIRFVRIGWRKICLAPPLANRVLPTQYEPLAGRTGLLRALTCAATAHA